VSASETDSDGDNMTASSDIDVDSETGGVMMKKLTNLD
jgi:hypothetical protein